MFADFKASFPQVTIFSLAQVPVFAINPSNREGQRVHEEVIAKVNAMLTAMRHFQDSRTDKDKAYYRNRCAALDRQIDRLVYDLYGLTGAEVEMVELATQ
jgi:predicted YcjX-like family ATPase